MEELSSYVRHHYTAQPDAVASLSSRLSELTPQDESQSTPAQPEAETEPQAEPEQTEQPAEEEEEEDEGPMGEFSFLVQLHHQLCPIL